MCWHGVLARPQGLPSSSILARLSWQQRQLPSPINGFFCFLRSAISHGVAQPASHNHQPCERRPFMGEKVTVLAPCPPLPPGCVRVFENHARTPLEAAAAAAAGRVATDDAFLQGTHQEDL
jgi:hypothetical protein